MTNPDTGKPKGFGFADFADADSAASAVRNLNDYEIQGRKIRVDWPHNQEKDSSPQSTDQAASGPGQDGIIGPSGTAVAGLPPFPPGTDLPPNLKATDAISQTLNALPPQQLLDVLTQMKSLAVSDPNKATELLKQAPQLSYAIFQALILMNLVDPKILAQVVEQTARPQQATMPQQQQLQPTAQQYPGYAPPAQPGMPMTSLQMMGSRQPPPQQPPPQPQYGQLVMQQQQQQPQPQPPAGQMSQEEMIRQVLAMDQRTIDSLPPTERMQIIQLRQQLGVR